IHKFQEKTKDFNGKISLYISNSQRFNGKHPNSLPPLSLVLPIIHMVAAPSLSIRCYYRASLSDFISLEYCELSPNGKLKKKKKKKSSQ
ncbi:hypothetical protein TorRG33x02_298660, partial [Trema orientale]